MTADDSSLYRRNPAREIEQIAVATITCWLAGTGLLTDGSAGNGPDFWIEYHDGRRAVGEVSWHEDGQIQEMWKSVFKREDHQIVHLPEGAGRWGVGLHKGAHIGLLYAELPGLIAELNRLGKVELEPEYMHPHDPLRAAAARLGINYLRRVESSTGPATAMFFMPSSGGAIPSDPNVIVDWIESVLDDPSYSDVTEKLLKVSDVDERHVFVMSGSATPFGVDERLMRLDTALPGNSPRVPEGITHLWVLSRWTKAAGTSCAGLWIRGSGWSHVAILPI